MKSDDEEDVSLYTIITVTHSSGVVGFAGTLTCIFEWDGVTHTDVFPVEDL